MSRTLPAQHQRFVAEYLKDLNGKAAAIRAGYAPTSAKVTACRLLRKPSIAAALAARQQRVLRKAELSGARVLEELRRLAFLDPAQLFYPPEHAKAGTLKPIHEMPEDIRACLATIAVVRLNLNTTEGPRDNEWLHKITYYDKVKALALLARHFALLNDVVEVSIDWEKAAARLASVRNEPPADPRKYIGPRT